MAFDDIAEPVARLQDPAERTEEILGQPFSNPGSILDWTSPTHIVNEFVSQVVGLRHLRRGHQGIRRVLPGAADGVGRGDRVGESQGTAQPGVGCPAGGFLRRRLLRCSRAMRSASRGALHRTPAVPVGRHDRHRLTTIMTSSRVDTPVGGTTGTPRGPRAVLDGPGWFRQVLVDVDPVSADAGLGERRQLRGEALLAGGHPGVADLEAGHVRHSTVWPPHPSHDRPRGTPHDAAAPGTARSHHRPASITVTCRRQPATNPVETRATSRP
jgi:hypothetical protein